jgi:hypothetical protein
MKLADPSRHRLHGQRLAAVSERSASFLGSSAYAP